MSGGRSAACAAALAGLPGMGPAALARLLERWGPEEAWGRVLAGEVARPSPTAAGRAPARRDPAGADASPRLPLGGETAGRVRLPVSWRDAARRIDPAGRWAALQAGGIHVTWLGQPDYPAALVEDPLPPAVLFWRGSLHWLERPCVAVVGTRRASPDGLSVAFELGRDLAAAGVCVVSGLALGIDGAAHRGAVRGAPCPGGAGPVGVAASGVDVPYSRRHAGLWEEVARAGAVLSETPPGRAAHAWRFPARNRVIAGLVRMVVVVESHARGGSLITADAAIARGIDVRAVPGPVHSPASGGSNQLLYDGPGPVRDATDVLDGLGILRPAPADRHHAGGAMRGGPARAAGPRSSHDGGADPGPRPARPADPRALPGHPTGQPSRRPGPAVPEGPARAVLAAIGWRPVSLNRIAERAGIDPGRAVMLLEHLCEAGLVRRDGPWWTRIPTEPP